MLDRVLSVRLLAEDLQRLVVIDATVAVALANPFDPRKVEVGARLAMWDRQGAELHAPELLPYEFAAAVRRLVERMALPDGAVAGAWEVLAALGLTFHPLTDGVRVTAVGNRLRRRSCTDAAYLVLADRLRGQLWTLDRRLARDAGRLGFRAVVVEW